MMRRHPFAFTPAYRLACLPFGVTPRNTWAEVSNGILRVRFGPWRLYTRVDNVAAVRDSFDYAFLKTAGPAHLSLADHGITFATNPRHGLCVTFAEMVRVRLPIGHLRCSAATLTVAEPDALRLDLGHG